MEFYAKCIDALIYLFISTQDRPASPPRDGEKRPKGRLGGVLHYVEGPEFMRTGLLYIRFPSNQGYVSR